MKKIKSVLIFLLILLILVLVGYCFKDEIFSYVYVKKYENKYKDINLSEKTLYFNQNTIEENTIDINGFKISISDFKYNKDEGKLDFNLEFENESSLYNVGYILRVYNTEYCLGDRFNGQISFSSAIDYLVSYNKFYEENFGNQNQIIDMTNVVFSKNDLKNSCKMSKEDELLENGNLIHKISFDLPEEFIINDSLKIELFDLNYQNIGDKTVYQVQAPLAQVRYTLNFSKDISNSQIILEGTYAMEASDVSYEFYSDGTVEYLTNAAVSKGKYVTIDENKIEMVFDERIIYEEDGETVTEKINQKETAEIIDETTIDVEMEFEGEIYNNEFIKF